MMVFVTIIVVIVVILTACLCLVHQCADTIDVGVSHRHGDVRQDTPDQGSTSNGDAPINWVAREKVSLEQRRQRRSTVLSAGNEVKTQRSAPSRQAGSAFLDEDRAPSQNYQFAVPPVCSKAFTWTAVAPPTPRASPQSPSWSSRLRHTISVSLGYV